MFAERSRRIFATVMPSALFRAPPNSTEVSAGLEYWLRRQTGANWWCARERTTWLLRPPPNAEEVSNEKGLFLQKDAALVRVFLSDCRIRLSGVGGLFHRTGVLLPDLRILSTATEYRW